MKDPETKPILETERLYLREMDEADFPLLSDMLEDPIVMVAYEHTFPEEERWAWLRNQQRRYREFGFGLWAVCLRETDELVGQCGITWQDMDGLWVLEVGYLFRRAFWHRGYAIEAARACRDYAFTALGAREVYSFIREENLPSQAVAKKNGMTVCGMVQKFYRGNHIPHLLFRAQRPGDLEPAAEESPVVFRHMTISDYEPAMKLWSAVPGMGMTAQDDSKAAMERFLRRNPNTSFAAVRGCALIGTILAGNDGRRGYLYHLAVDEKARGKGVGTHLLNRALEALQKEGIPKTALVAFSANEAGNAFWEKRGFRVRGDLSYRDFAPVPLTRLNG